MTRALRSFTWGPGRARRVVIALIAVALAGICGHSSFAQTQGQAPTQTPTQGSTQTQHRAQHQLRPPATTSNLPNEANVLPAAIDVATFAGKIHRRGDHYVLNDATVPRSLVLLKNPSLLKKYSGKDVLVTGPLTPAGEMLVQRIDPVIAPQDKR